MSIGAFSFQTKKERAARTAHCVSYSSFSSIGCGREKAKRVSNIQAVFFS